MWKLGLSMSVLAIHEAQNMCRCVDVHPHACCFVLLCVCVHVLTQAYMVYVCRGIRMCIYMFTRVCLAWFCGAGH